MKYINGLILILFGCCLVACECEEEQLINPLTDPDTFRITGAFFNGESEVSIFFNKPADRESVLEESSLILRLQADGPEEPEEFYQVEFWSDDNQMLIIEVFYDDYCEFAIPNDPCMVDLQMISDKDAPLSVRSATGQLLDGNRDGSDGDDYNFTFSY